MEILPSGKTGTDIFDNRTVNPNKVLDRLSMRIIAQSLRKFYEVVRGWCYSGDEASATAIDEDLSIITASNIADYESTFTQGLNTLIAFNNTLEVDGTSTENAIVLVPKKISSDISPNSTDYSTNCPLPLKYQDELEFTFRAIANNTGSMTISIPSLSGLAGTMDLVDESGNALVGGEITTGKYVKIKLKTISSVKKAILLKSLTTLATTSTSGTTLLPQPITIANNGTDADHDLDFGTGNFQFDDGSGVARLTAMTKRFDATWVAGTGNGGLDTGSLANNTPYYIYAIYNPTTLVSDVLATATKGSPTMPSGFTKKQYLAGFRTDGSANIRNGTYRVSKSGYEFIYKVGGILDVNTTTIPTTRTALPLTVLPLSKVNFIATYVDDEPGDSFIVFTEEGQDNEVPDGSDDLFSDQNFAAKTNRSMWTNSSAQIYWRGDDSAAILFYLKTLGWSENY